MIVLVANVCLATLALATSNSPAKYEAGDVVRILDSYEDLRGTLFEFAPNETIQVTEYRLGIGSDGQLCTALVQGVAIEDGSYRSRDHRSNCRYVFDRVSDLRGFNLQIGRETRFVESITFGYSLNDGICAMLAAQVLGSAGERVEKSLDPTSIMQHVQPNCEWKYSRKCSGQGTCTGTCPAPLTLAPCPCSGGTGECQDSIVLTCPPNGKCPPGQVCTESGINCNCQ